MAGYIRTANIKKTNGEMGTNIFIPDKIYGINPTIKPRIKASI
jgi:hypothetical protein